MDRGLSLLVSSLIAELGGWNRMLFKMKQLQFRAVAFYSNFALNNNHVRMTRKVFAHL